MTTDDYPLNGRFVVLCDDGSIIATDDLMDGDNVIWDHDPPSLPRAWVNLIKARLHLRRARRRLARAQHRRRTAMSALQPKTAQEADRG